MDMDCSEPELEIFSTSPLHSPTNILEPSTEEPSTSSSWSGKRKRIEDKFTYKRPELLEPSTEEPSTSFSCIGKRKRIGDNFTYKRRPELLEPSTEEPSTFSSWSGKRIEDNFTYKRPKLLEPSIEEPSTFSSCSGKRIEDKFTYKRRPELKRYSQHHHSRLVGALAVTSKGYNITNGVTFISADFKTNGLCMKLLNQDLQKLKIQRLFIAEGMKIGKDLAVPYLKTVKNKLNNVCYYCHDKECHRWKAVNTFQCLVTYRIDKIKH